MTADEILTRVQTQGLHLLGFSMPDPSDVTTWRLDLKRGTTDNDRQVILQALRRALIPDEITRFQATEALRRAGRLADVEAALAALTDQSSEQLKTADIAWDTAQVFRRNSPTLAAFATLLNLNDQQLDALFVTAAQIEA